MISCGPDDGKKLKIFFQKWKNKIRFFWLGCHGGDSGNANAFMASGDGITDETCSIYR